MDRCVDATGEPEVEGGYVCLESMMIVEAMGVSRESSSTSPRDVGERVVVIGINEDE